MFYLKNQYEKFYKMGLFYTLNKSLINNSINNNN